MLLGAFLDGGVPAPYLREELNKLNLQDEFELKVTKVEKNGISATYVEVILLHHDHDADSLQDHHHRHLSDIRSIIEQSSYNESVKKNSIAIFNRIAAAEAKVHGTTAEQVHFHEVGAVDAIVDIVGAAICLDYLQVHKIYISKLNVGTGFIQCAHGIMPIPAPATAELLKGIAFQHGSIQNELVTPTGAAILAVMADKGDGEFPENFNYTTISYGAGTWNLKIPNVLRMYIGTLDLPEAELKKVILETNIDDQNPQIYEYLSECLFAAGALDVWLTPIIMKKNRPAHQLSVLLESIACEKCIGIIFRETSTIGLRIVEVDRIAAERSIIFVETPWGKARAKVSYFREKIIHISAEYQDCKKIACKTGVPLKKIQLYVTNLANGIYSNY